MYYTLDALYYSKFSRSRSCCSANRFSSHAIQSFSMKGRT